MTTKRERILIDSEDMFAREVMRTDVLVLQADDPIRSAAEQLQEIRASGAPVVDASGRLLGVLTLSDIARSEHVDDEGVTTRLRAEPEPERTMEAEGVDEERIPSEAFLDDVSGRARVADWMSPGVTTVAPDESVAAVCRVMLDEDIHRVFVSEGGRLRGVISTKDVVALLALPAAKGKHHKR